MNTDFVVRDLTQLVGHFRIMLTHGLRHLLQPGPGVTPVHRGAIRMRRLELLLGGQIKQLLGPRKGLCQSLGGDAVVEDVHEPDGLAGGDELVGDPDAPLVRCAWAVPVGKVDHGDVTLRVNVSWIHSYDAVSTQYVC